MTHRITARRGGKILIYCFLCFSFFGTHLLHAEKGQTPGKNEVLVIGTGPIVKDNLALARKTAISHALMKGVERYLVRRLGSQGLVNNFQRVVQDIIPGAKEEIENFHILAEDRIGDDYKILVRLKINENLINERLRGAALVLAEGPPIKVLFLVSETMQGRPLYWWKDPQVLPGLSLTELALHNAFQKRGFRPMNRTLGLPETEYSEDLRSADLQVAGILQWGRLFAADVVICGQSDIVDEKDISLTLKAFDVNRGFQICEAMQIEQIREGPEGREKTIETLERLGNHLAARLTAAIIRMTASDHEKIRQLTITLKDLTGYRQLRVFMDFLKKDVTGVKSVRQTRVRRNSISISVEFKGDTTTFIERVLRHENLPFPLIVDKTENGTILFSANP